MTQDRIGAGSKDSSYPPTSLRDAAKADHVDAPMQLVELPPLNPHSDRSTSHAHRKQLPSSNHPMLPPRELRDLPVKKSSVQLTLYMRANCTLASHAADAEAAGRNCGAQIVPIQWREAHEKGPNPPLPPLALIPSCEGGCLLLIPRDAETCQLPRRLCWVKR
jgi:hypothetical protein